MIQIEEKLYNKMPPEVRACFDELPNPEREEVVSGFPDSKSTTGKRGGQGFHNAFGRPDRDRKDGDVLSGHNDSGSASRFFYCAKASKADRNEGLEEFEEKQYSHDGRDKETENAYQRNKSISSNNHPTVKPTKLMQYLVRLVTPKNRTVLDPFCGSGSTGKACVLEGFDFIGIDMDESYCKIAEARIKAVEDDKLNKLL